MPNNIFLETKYTIAVQTIKTVILQSQYQAIKLLNKEQLALYYGIGRYISQFPVGEPNTAYAKYFKGNSYLAQISDSQIHAPLYGHQCGLYQQVIRLPQTGKP